MALAIREVETFEGGPSVQNREESLPQRYLHVHSIAHLVVHMWYVAGSVGSALIREVASIERWPQ